MFACGVGNNEEAFSLVRCADIGRSDKTPPRVIPERGKVRGHDRETFSEMTRNVFEYHSAGSENGDGVSDPGPEVSWVVDAESLSRGAEGLAGISGGENVDALNSTPLNGLQVAEVRHVGVVLFHQPDGAWFHIGPPR
jgi:hypothetical protein